MTNAITRPGSFCWFELTTTDQDAAKRFYADLFGWTPDDTPIGPSDLYTIFRLAGRDAAAACTIRPEQRAQGVPPNWLVYIQVEHADDSAARATSLGATVVVPPFDVMQQGRMALIADPGGAMFAIWQPNQHTGIGVWGDVNAVCWADLQVRDQVAAGAFYSAFLGWQMVEGASMNAAKPGTYFHIANAGTMIGGIPPADQVDPNGHPAWIMYVRVADCAASTKKAVSLGARAFVDSMTLPDTGTFSVIADPQGAVFSLFELQPR